jgi:hypothetical protein
MAASQVRSFFDAFERASFGRHTPGEAARRCSERQSLCAEDTYRRGKRRRDTGMQQRPAIQHAFALRGIPRHLRLHFERHGAAVGASSYCCDPSRTGDQRIRFNRSEISALALLN